MRLKHLAKGIATYIPGVNEYIARGTGGTDSARYCYSVWLKHLVMAKTNNLNPYPKVVAELGPGDSVGIGLAALISGADKYYAFDIHEFANTEKNLKIFDELITLFKSRADIPGDVEFPRVKPYLEDYQFPIEILDEARLETALQDSRLSKIRASIINMQQPDSVIQYKAPWYDTAIVEHSSVDMLYSQAVLEHVDDLPLTYKVMGMWLKSDGFMSHQIDFKCHGTADEWNGHWQYSDWVWRLTRGNRPYLLNREPHSTHISLLSDNGFKVTCDKKIKAESKLSKDQFIAKYHDISESDLTTSGAFIQSIKVPAEALNTV